MNDEYESSRLEISSRNKELIREVFELESDGHKDARDLFKEEILGFLISTDGGSYTLSSGKRGEESETLHSTFGARTEAFEKFVIPSKILDKAENMSIVKVLDICSGIGYNVSALLDYLKDVDVEIEIDMVESSLETIATTLFIPDICESHKYVKKAIETYLIKEGYLHYNKVLSTIPPNVHINIHVCDARDYVKICKQKEYDAVFLDPFSPAKCPELYTVDFFTKLKEYLTPTALILTYTAASPIRSAFVDAGLYVGEGPRFHRSGGTIASRSPDLIDTPLSFSDVKVIALSDVGIPFLDPDLNDDYRTIIERRQNQRKHCRGVSMFPSSAKLPRFLGLNPDDIEDVVLRDKLNHYVNEMGFDGLNDERIVQMLNIEPNLSSRDQIIALKNNLYELLNNN
jgi:tRNA U34 5-methylaminomethyl-2-thiouridine-forming methyltransferase MnmC